MTFSTNRPPPPPPPPSISISMYSAALKRLGADDKGERTKELEERKRTEDLTEVIVELQTEILKLNCSLDAEKNLVQSYLTKVSHWEEAKATRLAESMAAADEECEIKSKLESKITSLQKEIAISRFPVIDQGCGDISEPVKAHNKPLVNAQTSAISPRGREKIEPAYSHAVANSDTDTKLRGDEGDTLSQIPWEDVERDEGDGTSSGTRAGTDTRGTEKLDKSEGASGSGGSKLVLHHRVNLAAHYVCPIPVHPSLLFVYICPIIFSLRRRVPFLIPTSG